MMSAIIMTASPIVKTACAMQIQFVILKIRRLTAFANRLTELYFSLEYITIILIASFALPFIRM